MPLCKDWGIPNDFILSYCQYIGRFKARKEWKREASSNAPLIICESLGCIKPKLCPYTTSYLYRMRFNAWCLLNLPRSTLCKPKNPRSHSVSVAYKILQWSQTHHLRIAGVAVSILPRKPFRSPRKYVLQHPAPLRICMILHARRPISPLRTLLRLLIVDWSRLNFINVIPDKTSWRA